MTGQRSGTTPVVTLSVAGGIIAQKGLGQSSPTVSLTDSSNGASGDVDSALDAATDEVVASWDSLAGKGSDFIKGAVPTVQAAAKVPGIWKNEAVISGRDTGAGSSPRTPRITSTYVSTVTAAAPWPSEA